MLYSYEKRIYSENKIKELSNIFVKELSSGVYYIDKDRYEKVGAKYIDSKELSVLLENFGKVSVSPLLRTGGNIVYSNTIFDEDRIKYNN